MLRSEKLVEFDQRLRPHSRAIVGGLPTDLRARPYSLCSGGRLPSCGRSGLRCRGAGAAVPLWTDGAPMPSRWSAVPGSRLLLRILPSVGWMRPIAPKRRADGTAGHVAEPMPTKIVALAGGDHGDRSRRNPHAVVHPEGRRPLMGLGVGMDPGWLLLVRLDGISAIPLGPHVCPGCLIGELGPGGSGGAAGWSCLRTRRDVDRP